MAMCKDRNRSKRTGGPGDASLDTLARPRQDELRLAGVLVVALLVTFVPRLGLLAAGANEEPAPSAPASAEDGTSDSPQARVLDEPTSGIEFVTNVRYLAENRPAWLEEGPRVTGDTLWLSVKGGPYQRLADCRRELDGQLREAVDEYICDFLGDRRAANWLSYPVDEIRERLVDETFQEQLETSVGLMNQIHARLRFGRAFQDELHQRWQQLRMAFRLVRVIVWSLTILGVLAVVYGYFRLDTATRGYYSGRLQFAVVAAILGVVAASFLLAKWIPWM